jgi:hypothetical protein
MLTLRFVVRAQGNDMDEFDVDTPFGKAAMKELVNRVTHVDRWQDRFDDSDSFQFEFNDPKLTMVEFATAAAAAFEALEVTEKALEDKLSVKGFLNRLFGIKMELQNEVFKAFHGRSRCPSIAFCLYSSL